MGLNGIRNPAKLRKLSALIGEPVTYACARFFKNQRDLLVFGISGQAYAANLRTAHSEVFTDPEYTYEPYLNKEGVYSGVSRKAK